MAPPDDSEEGATAPEQDHSSFPCDGTDSSPSSSTPSSSASSRMENAADDDASSSFTNANADAVIVGPDLNVARSATDRKKYRQILLKSNGLRALLISDTVAMNSAVGGAVERGDDAGYESGDGTSLDDDDDDDEEEEEGDDASFEENEEEEGGNEGGGGPRKAAAALLVNVGSHHDPPNCHGLAHFLEHMLFMGTELHPSENAYDKFLSSNGGSDNAYTELEHTVFHLEIPQDKLNRALDMFAGFFVCPLLREEAADRELNAIESEFRLSQNSDECRLQQLLCHTSSSSSPAQDDDEGGDDNSGESKGNGNGAQQNQQEQPQRHCHHPFSQFSWGNLRSLRDIPAKQNVDVHAELRSFYNRHYFAPNMRLAVVGAYTVDELQNMVVQHFANVPASPRVADDAPSSSSSSPSSLSGQLPASTHTDPLSWDKGSTHSPLSEFGMPFDPERTLGKIYRVVPVRDRHSLSITWQIPSQIHMWKSKPADYLAHLLGHEASGSLLSSLKAKGWVLACHAGVGSGGHENGSSHALFNLTFALNQAGVGRWADIVSVVYQYVGMLRWYASKGQEGEEGGDGGFPHWIFDELRIVQELAYRYGDEPDPVDLVEDLVEDMAPWRGLPPDRLLDGTALLFEYDGDAVRDLLETFMTPRNARVDLLSSSFGREGDYGDEDDGEGESESGDGDESKDDNVEMDTEREGGDRGGDVEMDDGEADASSSTGIDMTLGNGEEMPRAAEINGHEEADANANAEDDDFSPDSAGPPLVEPYFGTKYWSHLIPSETLDAWEEAARPKLPTAESHLALPPVNPYVPTRFDLKLPEIDGEGGCNDDGGGDDASHHHPLLRCSLEMCIANLVGRDEKTWQPAKATRFDAAENRILFSYERDDDAMEGGSDGRWHRVDLTPEEYRSASPLSPDFEGSLDNDAVRFRIVAVPVGTGHDDGDHGAVEDDTSMGTQYPPIPPPLPESHLPALAVDTPAVRLWHLQDRKFQRPIAELRLKVVCSGANCNRTPLHRACADLCAELVRDAVTETSYLASVCELGSSIGVTDYGFTLRVHGFDDKLLNLAKEILAVLLGFRCRDAEKGMPDFVQPGRFEACQEALLRRYDNEGMNASSLCTDVRLRCIRPTIWSSHSKAEALRRVDAHCFLDTIAKVLRELSVEGFFHGNVDRSDAGAAAKVIADALAASGGPPAGLSKEQHPQQRVIRTPHVEDSPTIVAPAKDPKEPNTAVEVYFQIARDELSHRVLIDLLSQLFYEPLFDKLRTKEQFGYHVSCGARWTHGVIGLSFKVVTSCRSADEVSSRLDQFLHDFRDEMVAMSDETFTEHVVGLANSKLQAFNSLEEECDSLWSEITEGRYEWEVYRNEAVSLCSVTKEQVLAAFDEWFHPTCQRQGKGKKRRKLVVHVIGAGEGAASAGRPHFDPEGVGRAIDHTVSSFHQAAGMETWGEIHEGWS